MDKINLTGVKLYAYHGVLDAEREIGQYFIVDVTLFADLRKAGETDDVNDTINYAEVYDVVEEIVQGQPVNLIEHLAENIINEIFNRFSKTQKLQVKVTKPNPPINGTYENVSVELIREREK